VSLMGLFAQYSASSPTSHLSIIAHIHTHENVRTLQVTAMPGGGADLATNYCLLKFVELARSKIGALDAARAEGREDGVDPEPALDEVRKCATCLHACMHAIMCCAWHGS